MKKFHRYLYGRKFNLVTDHKRYFWSVYPAARLQRWAILLSAYSYEIQYKSTREHSNADGLSRLPLPNSAPESTTNGAVVFNIGQPYRLLFMQFRKLLLVIEYLVKYIRMPNGVGLIPSKNHERTKSVLSPVAWIRVIVPTSLQSTLLTSLHENHPGITKMKSLARSYFWWNGMDKAIETQAKSCAACQAGQNSPSVAPLHPWAWPESPWKRIHIDFAGPFLGKMFLIIVDAHSKWPSLWPPPLHR